jgi:hypothetical protein
MKILNKSRSANPLKMVRQFSSGRESKASVPEIPRSFNYSPKNQISRTKSGITVYSQKMFGGVST